MSTADTRVYQDSKPISLRGGIVWGNWVLALFGIVVEAANGRTQKSPGAPFQAQMDLSVDAIADVGVREELHGRRRGEWGGLIDTEDAVNGNLVV